jgi:anti-sigma B factor antagonist
MSLDIQQSEREGIVLLNLKGRLTVGPEASALRDRIAELAKAGSVNLILNLEDIAYIDSTGLGALVMSATSVRKQGGNIKLLNMNRRNIELLVMTKIATVFDLFTDEQDAVNSFFPDRKVKAFDILNFVQQMKEE